MRKLCAIVAVLALGAGGLWAAPWFTDVTAQVEGGTGEGNQNELTLHLGLGERSGPAVLLEISWPDGEHEMVPTPVDRLITVTQR